MTTSIIKNKIKKMANVSFKPLKNLVLPKISTKLTNLAQPNKVTTPKLTIPKISNSTTPKPFNFSNITKVTKLPKTPKMTILKTAVKKVKNAGF